MGEHTREPTLLLVDDNGDIHFKILKRNIEMEHSFKINLNDIKLEIEKNNTIKDIFDFEYYKTNTEKGILKLI